MRAGSRHTKRTRSVAHLTSLGRGSRARKADELSDAFKHVTKPSTYNFLSGAAK